MFRSNTLPPFVFVDENGGDEVFRPAEAAARISAIAARLRSSVKSNACVGLLFKSEPNLIVNWLACLAAGVRPLIMQYPTKKQSRDYWLDSVQNTIAIAEIAAIIADENCAGLGLDMVAVIAQPELDRLPDGPADPLVFEDFAIVQLSSGTTGYRKAMQFDSVELRRHVDDYNATLRLTPNDKLVSWLPLYHDMGLIACFVMPMALGVDIVMLDPMTWVNRPELLYDAIGRHAGTCCYMPNFGFEMMARLGPRRLPTMRWWISCSEPISAETSRKFLESTNSKPETFAPCYAMAENIFAATFRAGLNIREIDGTAVVSCGPPIKGVEIKTVEGEVWLRSPTSLKSYIGSGDVRDAEGYYATGDIGEIVDGELYVTGRKQDLLIQAGKKYMLSSIDLVLNSLYPDIRGRAAAVSVYDNRLGTQKPVVLIEATDFFLRTDQNDIAAALKSVTDLDQIEVQFVPPRFLTKTSSGKFNRKKSAENWLLVQQAERRAAPAPDPIHELRAAFENVAQDKPVAEILDSLSLTVLRIILSETHVAYDSKLSLDEICAKLKSTSNPKSQASDGTIRIVSLADSVVIRGIKETHLRKLAAQLGAPVTLEHVCLPPSPIALSDLVFMDYFRPRLDGGAFASVETAFDKLRDASLILVDDFAEMLFPPVQVYATLSHNLERHPDADLISVRWQRYPQFHDQLPVTVVSGADLPLETRSAVLEQLSAYLKKPIFRIATLKGFEQFTKDWEFRRLKTNPIGPLDPDNLTEHLLSWLKRLPGPLHRSHKPCAQTIDLSDMRHYCSHFIDKSNIDKVLPKFEKFCIVGQNSSVPYIRRELQRRGKSFVTAPSYSPQVLGNMGEDFDCLLVCGAMGKYRIECPAIAIMATGNGWTTKHIDDPELESLKFDNFIDDPPSTREDWFSALPVARDKNWAEWDRARQAVNEAKNILPSEREKLAERRRRRKRHSEDRAVQTPILASNGHAYYQSRCGFEDRKDSQNMPERPAKPARERAAEKRQKPKEKRERPQKEVNELQSLKRKRAYILERLAILKQELKALSAERTEIDSKLRAEGGVNEVDAKSLRQRRIYVAMRPESLKVEMSSISAELKQVSEKLTHLRPS